MLLIEKGIEKRNVDMLVIQKGIRVKMYHAIYQYFKTINIYIRDFDQNK